MITPDEKNKLNELTKKKNNYISLTDEDINKMSKIQDETFNKFQNFIIACQPFWHDVCEWQLTLAKQNTRLLMEINYLKEELSRYKK